MFDVGFWELMLIAVVALLVVGPDRMPELARTAGRWVGRMRRFVATVKSDVDREMRAEDLRRALDKQNQLGDVYDVIRETRSEVEASGTVKEGGSRKQAPDAASESTRNDGEPGPSQGNDREGTGG